MKKKQIEIAELIPTNEHINVSGVLSFQTVPQLRAAGNQFIQERTNLIFDFHKTTRCDSAALSLLTAWTRYAASKNKKIKFVHLPQQLSAIAKMSGLTEILPIV